MYANAQVRGHPLGGNLSPSFEPIPEARRWQAHIMWSRRRETSACISPRRNEATHARQQAAPSRRKTCSDT